MLSKYRNVLQTKGLFALLLFFALLGFLLENVGLFLPARFLDAPENSWNVVVSMYEWLEVSYFDHGIVGRAFVGTILAPLPEDTKYAAYIAVQVLVIVGIFSWVARSLNRLASGDVVASGILLASMFILSPMGAIQIGFTFGRFDIINILLLIVTIQLMISRRHIAGLACAVVGVLIHEAFLIYGWPVVVAFLFKSQHGDQPLGQLVSRQGIAMLGKTACWIGFPLLLVGMFLTFGTPESVRAVGTNRGFFEIPELNWLNTTVPFLLIVSIASVQFAIYDRNQRSYDMVAIAPYFSLILFVFGVDYARWCGLFFWVLMISTLFQYETRYLLHPLRLERANRAILVPACGMILAPIILGPIGVVSPFPVVDDLITLASKLAR